jgi:glycine/D-amino acid oxidase-like deaminating enzyme
MTLSIWLDRPADKVCQDFDVVIVGGGIMGAGCAYWLSQRSNLKVVLLEAGQLASGASGRNAGFILRGIQSYYNQAVKLYGRDKAQEIYRFAESGRSYLQEFADKYGNSFELNPCGSYLLASSLEELQDLNESFELMQEDGFQVEYLKEDPLDRGFYGALHNACDAAVHPAKLVRALAQQADIEIAEAEPAVRLEQGDDGSIKVRTPKRVFRAKTVLLASNAYLPMLEESLLGKIEPKRGQILVTQPLDKTLLEKVCYANYGWEYFRQLPDNRLLLGGCREHFIEEEVGYADIITSNLQEALEDYLKDCFPEVAGVPIDYRWSGIMGFTADGLPLVGQVKRMPRAFFAAGFNGHGFSYGLAMSKLLVEAALDEGGFGQFACDRETLLQAAST